MNKARTNLEYISSAVLATGEFAALGALELTSIPHISIIDSRENVLNEIIAKYQGEITGLLNEVHQLYKDLNSDSSLQKDISLELLWITEAVKNQPYKARIKLHLVARAIDVDEAKAKATVSELMRLCKSTLAIQRYDCSEIDSDDLIATVSRINDACIKAVVKNERIENLQNQLVPCCLSYDRIQASYNDLSGIVNALVNYPDCAVSMQLMPTTISRSEKGALDATAQSLETLGRGIMEPGFGNISFALAERHADTYLYYSRHASSPLFAFNILVYGDRVAAASISNQLLGQLSTGREGTTNLDIVELNPGDVQKDSNYYPLPWAVNELLLNSNREIWSYKKLADLYRMPYIVTAEEASEFFKWPIGSDRISAGLTVNESSKTKRTYTDDIINAGDITIGELKASPNEDTIGISLNDLAKHMLIVGTPGSGKTTFSVGLLDRLWKEHHVPFLVIEPAKNEYRALVQSIPDLQVFTPGKNFISPFVFNPFVPPKNVRLETYKSTLKTAFAAGVSMTTPLDKIFEETVNNCYSDFRWLDTYTSDDMGQIFNISDFIKCFQQTFDEIGYTGDAKNVGRAGVVRLKSLTNLFDNYHSIPIEDILTKPTVIELAAIENYDDKALIIALLLLSILAYVNANYEGEGGLKNVILLEEAHVLLDADTNMGSGDAKPSAVAQNLVKRMLAEIRSYGVGIMIADQSPRKVSADVVALTDIKLVFHLVESADKQIIGDSTNMSDAQIRRMPRLKPGEAFLFFNKLDEPEEITVPDYRLENNIDITISDEAIKRRSTYWKNRPEKLIPYPQCKYCRYCDRTCDSNRRILARDIARRIFVRHFKRGSGDFEILESVFRRITRLVAAELNNEPLTPELMLCVKVHLWRKIIYETRIKVREIQVENSLKK